jgi:16S rRNA (guanine527-N7)-methyltransferase
MKDSVNQIKPLLQNALKQNGFTLSDQTQDALVAYLELLQRWNQAFNLTAITDPKDMVWLHILDSLSINPYLQGGRILDVGTGAGLPGIPLALLNPEKLFTLLDSNSKKTRFLTQVVLELNIKNVEVVHNRCEKFTPALGFDSIVSRAFSSIQDMLIKTQHLAAPNAIFLAMKGVYPESELNAIPNEFQVVAVHKLEIPGLAAERHLVCIKRNA